MLSPVSTAHRFTNTVCVVVGDEERGEVHRGGESFEKTR